MIAMFMEPNGDFIGIDAERIVALRTFKGDNGATGTVIVTDIVPRSGLDLLTYVVKDELPTVLEYINKLIGPDLPIAQPSSRRRS